MNVELSHSTEDLNRNEGILNAQEFEKKYGRKPKWLLIQESVNSVKNRNHRNLEFAEKRSRQDLLCEMGFAKKEQKQDKQEEQRLCTPEEFQRAWVNLGF